MIRLVDNGIVGVSSTTVS